MFFKRKPKLKNPEVIARLNSRAIKYVTTKDQNGVDLVLGRNGSINIKGEELIVFCEGKDLFRGNIYEIEVGELLSRDGVRLQKTNKDGTKTSVVAYYVNYR